MEISDRVFDADDTLWENVISTGKRDQRADNRKSDLPCGVEALAPLNRPRIGSDIGSVRPQRFWRSLKGNR